MTGPVLRRLSSGAPLFPLGVLFAIEALDQATRGAFNVLIPNVRDAFGLTNAGILLIVAVADAAALACTLPIALLADRSNRVRIALIGAAVSAVFCLGLGLAPTAIFAGLALAGMSMGQAVIFPTHNSLLADYYPVGARPRVYSVHRGGIALGAIIGVLVGAALAAAWSWRAPFIAFTIPIVVAAGVGLALREPPRGRHEQVALAEQMVGSELGEPAALDEQSAGPRADGPEPEGVEHPPSIGEAWRMVWKIGVLRRIFFALPLLAAAIAGFSSLASLQYQKTFHLDVTQRAFLVAPVQVFTLVGLALGAVVATRLAARGMSRVFAMLGVASVIAAGFGVLFALAPSVPVAFVANAGIEAALAVVAPGVLAALSLAIPPRARSVGFSIGALFVLPGLVVLPAVGALGDQVGFRYGLLLVVPVFVAGGLIVASAGGLIEADVRNVWLSIETRAKMAAERRRGEMPLLAVRELAVGYDGVPVVRGANLSVSEGEIVVLLGTNGAGKSTLLRALSGVTEADAGAVIFDGRDITHAPPDEIARLGVAQVPGGEGVFPALTVEENLRAATWQTRRKPTTEQPNLEDALALFSSLQGRRSARAGNLSGGQQQMLALAMALVAEPKLLVVDELSLGLAPIVVTELLAAVKALRDRGTAVVLVEQSVDLALSVAERGYVMDNGVISFSGTAEEIRQRPDLLRSIYLAKAGTALAPPVVPEAEDRGGPQALELREITVAFGGIVALDDVSLSVPAGEVVGVIGPNGAGKTTLFDAVSGFIRPTAGRVLVHGVDVTRRGPAARARLGLGRSFQDSRLFGGLTVAESLAVALERFVDVADPLNAVLRLPAYQDTEAAVARRVDELLELFGLERFAHQLVGELSTGSRRLVDLASVVGQQPDLVLLDEPSSGVAQREVEAMAEVLTTVRDHLDATMILVEHDIAFVSALADRLVALDRGAVLVSGSPQSVLQAPQVEEAFLGMEPTARSRSTRTARTAEGSL